MKDVDGTGQTLESEQLELLLALERDLLKHVSEDDDYRRTLERVCRAVENHIPGGFASILRLTDQEPTIDFLCAPGLTSETMERLLGIIQGGSPLPWYKIAAQTKFDRINQDPVLTDSTKRALSDCGIEDVWSVPITDKDEQPIGLLAVWLASREPPSLLHRRLLDTCGFVAGMVLQRADHERDLYRLAHHDPLTSLANRSLLERRLTNALSEARASGSSLAVMLIDLDHFKNVNDTLGHKAGDEVLVAISRRMEKRLRGAHTISRMGGDEFVLILDRIVSGAELEDIAYDLLGTISAPIQIGDIAICVNASIGISEYPRDGDSEKVLLQHSDAALLDAKAGGRNTYRFYRQEFSRDLNRRMEIDNGLRKAMDEGRLLCHFQPQFDTRTGDIVAFESLARWNHPERGLIEAREFIGEAEKSGVLNDVNMLLVSQAAGNVREWWRLSRKPFRLVVNVSAAEIAPGYADRIASTLADARFPAECLELEITERVLMSDDPVRKSELNALHESGVVLTLDDFGIGYSFFRDLRDLPFSRLKLGAYLVATMENQKTQTVLKSLMVLAEGLGIDVVAEGVETEVQSRQLQKLGCFVQQGYYHAPPLAAHEGSRFLEQMRSGIRSRVG